MKIVYISESKASVIESQVIELLNNIHLKGVQVELYMAGKHNSLAKALFPYKIIMFGPAYPLIHWFTLPVLFFSLRSISKDTLIHLRSDRCFRYLKILGYQNLYIDFRGLPMEENRSFKSPQLSLVRHLQLMYHAKRRESLEGVGYNANFVTSYMRDYYNLNLSSNTVSIIPSLISSKITYSPGKSKHLRRRYNIGPSDLVIVFSSSTKGKWQEDFRNYLHLIPSDVWLLNLSKTAIKRDRTINAFVDYDDIGHYLSMADIGFLFRTDHIVNKVALPVKGIEYLACGLTILSNGNIPSIQEMADTTGQLISWKELRRFNRPTKDQRIQKSVHWSNFFSVDVVTSCYIAGYKKILNA